MNQERTQCKYLTEENLCGKYSEIIKQPDWKFYPAFGEGCCSALNSRRIACLKNNVNLEENNGVEKDISI
jgi:hypothetical protein